MEFDEADHIAPRAAAVADEDAAVGVEVEVRAAVVLVERAAGDECRAGAAEGEAVAGDHLGEGAATLQLGRIEPGECRACAAGSSAAHAATVPPVGAASGVEGEPAATTTGRATRKREGATGRSGEVVSARAGRRAQWVR